MDDRTSSPDAATAPQTVTFEALLPAAMAERAEESGVRKASTDALTLLVLSVLAGAFISFGAIFATTVSAGTITVATADGGAAFSAGLPYGVIRLLTGLVFSLGLILVIVGGAELFTGNNMIVMAWAGGKVTTRELLFNWIVAFAGNFVGAILTAGLMFYTTQYTFGGGAVGLAALSTAHAKASLEFVPAVALGIMCNVLVCLAVWMCYGARTVVDKIVTIIPPITAFVLTLRLLTIALTRHPMFNSTWVDTAGGPHIHVHSAVHLGFGVAASRGLLVPVVKDAQDKSTRELAATVSRLIEQARAGTVKPAELQGSTFTVSNFGALGLDEGVPVINYPEAAILGMGSLKARPVVVDDAVVARPTMTLTCAFDHRIADGAQVASLLGELKRLIESPELALLDS